MKKLFGLNQFDGRYSRHAIRIHIRRVLKIAVSCMYIHNVTVNRLAFGQAT